jgi:hypothetical protein
MLLLASGFQAQDTEEDVLSVCMDAPDALALALGALTLLRKGVGHATASTRATPSPLSPPSTSAEQSPCAATAPCKHSDPQGTNEGSQVKGADESKRQRGQSAEDKLQTEVPNERQDSQKEAGPSAEENVAHASRSHSTNNWEALGADGAADSPSQSQASTSGVRQHARQPPMRQTTSPLFNGRNTKVYRSCMSCGPCESV